MSDDLAHRLARLVLEYSVAVQEGQMVMISGSTEAIPLINEIYRQVLRRGAHPMSMIDVPGQQHIFMKEAKDHQLGFENPFDLYLAEHIDVVIKIASETNWYDLASIPAEKHRRASEAKTRFQAAYKRRTASGELKSCYLPWVTTAMAELARRSNEEYATLIEKSCFLDQPDPVAAWEQLAQEQQRWCDYLGSTATLRLVNPGTDLTMSVRGRKWINSHGKGNLPDGEMFTGPVEDSVNGTITINRPARRAEGIVLSFRDGVVVEHKADKGGDYVAEMLRIPGANRLGEVAIGMNYGQETFAGHILFDEKMGGTAHVALGSGFAESGSRNTSALHWDLMVDMRQEGQIFADGRLIYERGRFVTGW